MGKPAIKVQGLWKEYILGVVEKRPDTFREMLVSRMSAPLRRLKRLRGGVSAEERFWALEHIDFSVRPGEIVGVIGRNGAGKTTLLQILSRITPPTRGRIEIRGRVASFLDIATGFHSELTGRENIYLRGVILGMSRREINKKFDEIVGFAEIEKFLDTPVKRYSSGMYVRLAFAIAGHVDPDVLLVDEVLAMGDIAFQEKCLGKIENMTDSGRTVLFVSHNMDSVRKLCTRGIWLDGGRLNWYGDIGATVERYVGAFHCRESDHVIKIREETSSGFYVDRIEVLDSNLVPKAMVKTWDDVTFRIVFYSPVGLSGGSVALQIATLSGTVLCLCSTQPDQKIVTPFKAGFNYIDCRFRKFQLSAGKYLIGAGLTIPNVEWLFKGLDSGVLAVHPRDVYQSGVAPSADRYLLAMSNEWGKVVPMRDWEQKGAKSSGIIADNV